MTGFAQQGKRVVRSIVGVCLDRVSTLISAPLRDEAERLKLQLGALQSRLVQKEIYQSIRDAEFRVFSQNGEDGIIQYLLTKIAVDTPTFVEIGVEDYSESNTRFLLMNNYWHGLIIDAGTQHLNYLRHHNLGWQFNIDAVSTFVTCANINDVLRNAGISGDIGLLSIDIDGNDYWVLDAVNAISARIVVVEYNSVFGPTAAVTVPYNPAFRRSQAHYSNLYYGASLCALATLMEQKGYGLVGSNRAGNNAFFLRNDVLGDIPTVTPAESYVSSSFRESRSRDGSLSYVGPMKLRLNEIGELPVVDIRRNVTLSVREAVLQPRMEK